MTTRKSLADTSQVDKTQVDKSRAVDAQCSELAFTLVELLIVVSILGILAAFVIPAFLGGAADHPGESQIKSEFAQEVTSTANTKLLPGSPPLIERAEIHVKMTPGKRRTGTTMQSLFAAQYRGVFTVHASDPSQAVRLTIPMPLGAEEAEDVTLTLEGAGYTGPADLRQVRIGIDGLHWSGPVPLEGHADKGPLVATVTFTVKGKNRFTLKLPPASGIHSLMATLDLNSSTALPIHGASLQPKTVSTNAAGGYTYTWSYQNLVSQRPIIIDLPAIDSPLARVMFMLRLVGLALLLFGCGFWYLVEGYEAGRLADFRWHHFLLLGLNYSLFFAIFVVCGFHDVDTIKSLWISAALSLPLLVWHTARIVDWRFAAKYTLPLVAFTIGIVINGVYGGEWRSFVFVGAAGFVIAYLTLSIEGLIKRQEARRKGLESDLTAEMSAIQPAIGALTETTLVAYHLHARRSDACLTEAREALQSDYEAGRLLIEQYQMLERVRLGLTQKRGLERSEDRRSITQGLFGLEQAAEERTLRLIGANKAIEEHIEALEDKERIERAKAAEKKKRKQAQRPPKREVHCIACGHGWIGSRHCPHCGVRRPEELKCTDCKTVLPLPVHLLAKPTKTQALHCPVCGKAHSTDTEWFVTT